MNTKVAVTKSNKKEKLRWNKSWQSLTFEDWHSCESTFLSNALWHPKQHSGEGFQARLAPHSTVSNSIKMKSEQNSGNDADGPGEKPVQLPLCPPQISCGTVRNKNRVTAVRSRPLTAWILLLVALTCSIWVYTYNFSLHLAQKTVCLITKIKWESYKFTRI
jgi:hypothetical protein